MSKSKRPVRFSKVENEWIARPFQGWEYKIISRWLKGYVLYFNGDAIASDTKLHHLHTAAMEHLGSFYPMEVV